MNKQATSRFILAIISAVLAVYSYNRGAPYPPVNLSSGSSDLYDSGGSWTSDNNDNDSGNDYDSGNDWFDSGGDYDSGGDWDSGGGWDDGGGWDSGGGDSGGW